MNYNMWRIWHCLVGYMIISIQAAPGSRKIVTINDGDISGVEGVTDDDKTTFWGFLGIPYAAPPLGDLRFMPPQSVQPWQGTLDASAHGNSCLQTAAAVPSGVLLRPASEDCLFLNVYTTNLERNSTLLPVMVFIHGGGFTLGSGSFGFHGGDRFMDNGVILVTFNYRLGVFGFLCTLDGASPGNYGLKDQIAALKWVKNNIAVFGGDPNRITIFGESAGAASVHYLLQTNLTKDLYQAAISESGSTLSTWAVAQYPRNLAFRLGASNLIITRNSYILVDRLRRLRATVLLVTAAVNGLTQLNQLNGLAWSPCLERPSQEAVIREYSYPLIDNGNFNRVPILTGFNSLEARDVNMLPWLVNLYSDRYILFPRSFVPKDMHAVNPRQVGLIIKDYYFGSRPVSNNTDFINYATDTLFVRGINKHVQLMSKYVPVYYYRFAFTGGSRHKSFNPEGVSHAEELQFLFNRPVNKQTTPDAICTQERMLKLWTNFAKYHNPTPFRDPLLSNITWPTAYHYKDNIAYLNIDTDLTVDFNPEEDQMQFWEELYQDYGMPPYNSY